MHEQQNHVKPNYDRYAGLELNDASRFIEQLSHFRGFDLAIVAIASIALFAEHDPPWLAPVSVVCIAALAIAHGFLTRGHYATPTQQSIQGTDEPGHARADQAPP